MKPVEPDDCVEADAELLERQASAVELRLQAIVHRSSAGRASTGQPVAICGFWISARNPATTNPDLVTCYYCKKFGPLP